ncbi:hypothetical protein PVAP13_3NG141360 [Panicum virgatum]|uniref:Uncharacterized protein n=1 Tax=Panicum virgatum TaxID=38727 RepID=A0A8T0U9A8_PANVG|nr:hypothetical protein PVAP13_3NG141360 [Panicum virgatum]
MQRGIACICFSRETPSFLRGQRALGATAHHRPAQQVPDAPPRPPRLLLRGRGGCQARRVRAAAALRARGGGRVGVRRTERRERPRAWAWRRRCPGAPSQAPRRRVESPVCAPAVDDAGVGDVAVEVPGRGVGLALQWRGQAQRERRAGAEQFVREGRRLHVAGVCPQRRRRSWPSWRTRTRRRRHRHRLLRVRRAMGKMVNLHTRSYLLVLSNH